MKFRWIAVVLVIAAVVSPAATANSFEDTGSFLSGKEWVRQMTPREKVMSLLPPMALYHKFGVRFQKSVGEYVDTLDVELAENPALENEDVASLFASTVYALEPENRLPLGRMSAVFEELRKRDPENLYPEIPITEE